MAYKQNSPQAVSEGGTGASTLTANKLLQGNGTSAITATTINVTASGEMTNTSQPAFCAVVPSGVTNVTGNGTTYIIAYSSEIFDQNNDYNNATYQLTSPVTGKYELSAFFGLSGIGTADDLSFYISTSNRDYYGYQLGIANIIHSTGRLNMSMSCIADMDAGDVALVKIAVNGAGANTVDINTYTAMNYFQGSLRC